MISEERRKLIEEKMKELPTSVKQAIDSSGWERKIFDIGKRYKLHIDHLDFLQFELALAMIGLSDQTEFMAQVKDHTGLDTGTVDKIVGDINTEIFSHIREKLKTDVYTEEEPAPTSFSGEEKLSDNEELEMKRAGVNLSGGPDEPEIREEEPEMEEVAPSEPVPAKVTPPVEEKKDTSPTQPTAQVFKTKMSEEGKPKNYFDPYREPIE